MNQNSVMVKRCLKVYITDIVYGADTLQAVYDEYIL